MIKLPYAGKKELHFFGQLFISCFSCTIAHTQLEQTSLYHYDHSMLHMEEVNIYYTKALSEPYPRHIQSSIGLIFPSLVWPPIATE